MERLTTPHPASTEGRRKKKNACERCRRSKVACHTDTFDEHGKCRRCYDSGKECVFVTLPPRKPRKRTDARVTVLEKELATMKNLFSQMQQDRVGPESHETTSSRSDSSRPSPSDLDHTPCSSSGGSEPVIPGYLQSTMLDEPTARALYNQYIREFIPQAPIVAFSLEDTFAAMKTTKPLLLFAAITAASQAREPSLFKTLHNHLVRIMTEKVVVNGERSLHLLQSILVLERWLCPPDDLRQLNFYQWVNIAGTMASQLGLVGNNEHSIVCGSEESRQQEGRAALAVYLACSTAAFTLRRQKVLHLTPSLKYWLQELEKPTSSLNDRRLASWVRLQQIAEEAGELLLLSRTDVSLFPRMFEIQSQFEAWRNAVDANVMTDSLRVHFEFSRSKLHELALHMNDDPEALVPPYIPSKDDASTSILNLRYARGIHAFVAGCHSLLNAFLSVPPEVIRICPTVTPIRVIYGLKGLMILQKALTKDASIENTLTPEELQLEAYLRAVIQHFDRTAGPLKCRVPSMIISLLKHLEAKLMSPPDVQPVQHTDSPDKCVRSDEWNTPTELGQMEPSMSGFFNDFDASFAFSDFDPFYTPEAGAFSLPNADDNVYATHHSVVAEWWQ